MALLPGATLAAPFSSIVQATPPAGLTAAKSGNDLILSFATTSTNFYGLQTRPDLLQPWTNLVAGIQGDGAVKRVTITNAISAGQGFYQLLLQPTPTKLLLPQATAFAILGFDSGQCDDRGGLGRSFGPDGR